MTRGLGHLSQEGRLRELGWFSLEREEKAPGRPWRGLPVPKGGALQESWGGTLCQGV